MQKLTHWKLVLLSLWIGLFGFALVTFLQSNIGLEEIPGLLENWLQQFGLWQAAVIYIVIYTFRPLILFPATLLTIASGTVFGPVLGIIFTIIGENFSAALAFGIARWMGRDWVKEHENQRLRDWEHRLQENGLITVLVMRLLMLPFDAVNYLCGLTSVRFRDFAIGTFLGILPALISFVLLGSALSGDNPYMLLGLSVAALGISILIMRHLKKSSKYSSKNKQSSPILEAQEQT